NGIIYIIMEVNIMRRKIIRFLSFLILIIMITLCLAPTVHAGLVSNARGESGSRPPPPTPPDAPQTKPGTPSTPTETGPKKITVTHMTIINGYVYEDIGQQIGTNGSDSSRAQIPVAGVTVNLLSGNSVVSSTVTDANGYYS